ncbi:MAG: hypothetical protein L3J33_03415 [Rhodobacteraceae bacterium]|nr:hypothetical protein [Paracoccaceae bacterium]
MPLTKRKEVDRIEIVGPDRSVQIWTTTIIEDDGVEIGRSNHRSILPSGSVSDEGVFIDPDLTNYDAEVAAIADAAWTPAVKLKRRVAGVSVRLGLAKERVAEVNESIFRLGKKIKIADNIIADAGAGAAKKSKAAASKAAAESSIALRQESLTKAEGRVLRLGDLFVKLTK